MIYTTRNDIELVFGARNVQRWADLDGDENETQIEARIQNVCELASAEIEDILRNRRYVFPLVRSKTLCDLVAKMAGLHLHDSRGVIDNTSTETDIVSRIRKEVEQKITHIRTGEILLEGERYGNAPQVVQDANMHKSETSAGFDPFQPYFGQNYHF
ncbi:MAG: DUF1320 family protein [Planctomycetia bacterium]|nr:DUF1320 family protein [Planctomycetia bacterium]